MRRCCDSPSAWPSPPACLPRQWPTLRACRDFSGSGGSACWQWRRCSWPVRCSATSPAARCARACGCVSDGRPLPHLQPVRGVVRCRRDDRQRRHHQHPRRRRRSVQPRLHLPEGHGARRSARRSRSPAAAAAPRAAPSGARSAGTKRSTRSPRTLSEVRAQPRATRGRRLPGQPDRSQLRLDHCTASCSCARSARATTTRPPRSTSCRTCSRR